MIRPTRARDVPLLPDIESAAGGMFRDIGMDDVADDEPLAAGMLLTYVARGRSWVATDAVDQPVAYLIVDVVDDAGHVAQVSVHPRHAGRGLGRALIERAAAWATSNGLAAVTLTTFDEVAWNRPYYERLGFEVVHPDDLGEELRAIRDHEAAVGLDRWPRVAMRRALDPEGEFAAPYDQGS